MSENTVSENTELENTELENTDKDKTDTETTDTEKTDTEKANTETKAEVETEVKPNTAVNDVTRGRRKIRVGKVVSTKMNKTIAVEIERRLKHPIYKKYFKKTKKFLAHDENNSAAEGDIVKIMETRPLSARKRWRLVEIVEKVK